MKRISQTEKVLSWLKVYGELTTVQAVEELHILALPRRVADLRQAGYDIRMNFRTAKNGMRYGVYTLAS